MLLKRNVCLDCGRVLKPEWKVCPYCGCTSTKEVEIGRDSGTDDIESEHDGSGTRKYHKKKAVNLFPIVFYSVMIIGAVSYGVVKLVERQREQELIAREELRQEDERREEEKRQRVLETTSEAERNESESQIYRIGEWVVAERAGFAYRIIRTYKTRFTEYDIWVKEGRKGDYADWFKDDYYVLGIVEIEVKGLSSEEEDFYINSCQIDYPISCWPYDHREILYYLNDNEENMRWVTQHTSAKLKIPFLIETNVTRHYPGGGQVEEDIVPEGRILRVGIGDTQVEIGYFK